VLLEAVVGIGMLAAIAAAVGAVHASALTAAVASEDRVGAVQVAVTTIEHHAAGLAGAPPVESPVSMELRRTPVAGDRCASFGAAGTPALLVEVPHASSGATVAILGVAPEAHEGAWMVEGGNGEAVHGPAETARAVGVALPVELPHGAGVQLRTVADGADRGGAITDGGACVVGDVTPDLVELRLQDAAGPPLVDALHRRAADAPIPLSVHGSAVRRTWDVKPAALLTVEVSASGARPPDEVFPVPLRWLVRGDDVGQPSVSGAARPVHPGRVSVVVSPCEDPSAHGSTAQLHLHAATSATLTVPLETVTVTGVAGRSDATLRLMRSTFCPEGGAWRPTLDWVGGLHDGMRIALPAGIWDVRIIQSGQTTLALEPLAAGEPNAALVLP
jgi:hypothetical protein